MITYNIEAFIGRNNPEKKAVVKCHDTGVCLCVSLKTERKASKWRTTEEAYPIPAGSSVVIKITKPDKKYVLQDGTFQGNKAHFELPPQSFTVAGMGSAEVNIFGKDGRRITTETFYIEVPQEVADDCAEDSNTYVSIMAEQIQAAMNAAERAENAAKRAESAGGNGGGCSAENGATFTPAVSEEGDLSWSNDKGLENPKTVNIKGPKGESGKTAYQYAKEGGYTGTEAEFSEMLANVSPSGDTSGYTLPIATADTLGGVKPVAKTSGMTQPVGVGADGRLYTEPSGEGGGNAPGVDLSNYYTKSETDAAIAGAIADIEISGGEDGSQGGNANIFTYSVTAEQEVNGFTVELPVELDKFYIIDFRISTDTGIATALALYSKQTNTNYKSYGQIVAGVKVLNLFGVRGGNEEFFFNLTQSNQRAAKAPPTLRHEEFVALPAVQRKSFTLYSNTSGANFPAGSIFEVWGVYKQ